MDFIVRSHDEKTALRSYTKVHCKLCLQCNSGFDNETFGPLGQLKSPFGTFRRWGALGNVTLSHQNKLFTTCTWYYTLGGGLTVTSAWPAGCNETKLYPLFQVAVELREKGLQRAEFDTEWHNSTCLECLGKKTRTWQWTALLARFPAIILMNSSAWVSNSGRKESFSQLSPSLAFSPTVSGRN